MQDLSADGFGELQARYLAKCECAGRELGKTAQNQLPAVNVSAVQQTIHQLVHSRGSFWWLTHQFGCFKTNLKGLVLNPSDGHKSR
jgi:hypothetical protein